MGGVPPPPPQSPSTARDDAAPPPPGGDEVTVTKDRWGAGRITALVAGILVALFALGFLAAGGVALWADRSQRDDAGYVTTGEHTFSTGTYALATRKIDLRYFPSSWLDRIRLRVTPTDPSGATFVGIARVGDVDRYLAGVGNARIDDFTEEGTTYDVSQGGAPPGPPADQGFWDASSSGTGERTLTWSVEEGRWAVVVMNADATPGVDVRADLGAKVPVLLWAGIGLLIAAVVFGGGSALLLWVAFRTRRK
jgi:hypothetical protein